MNFDFVVKINDEAIAGFSDPDTAYCYCLSLLENMPATQTLRLIDSIDNEVMYENNWEEVPTIISDSMWAVLYRRRQYGIKLAFIEWKDQYENMFMGGLLR